MSVLPLMVSLGDIVQINQINQKLAYLQNQKMFIGNAEQQANMQYQQYLTMSNGNNQDQAMAAHAQQQYTMYSNEEMGIDQQIEQLTAQLTALQNQMQMHEKSEQQGIKSTYGNPYSGQG